MITIRIEFVFEEERKALIESLKKDYLIVEESKIKPSRKEKYKGKLQFLNIIKRHESY